MNTIVDFIAIRHCAEPRFGMYTTGTNSRMDQLVSTCGDYATHTADGVPVCEVHSRRSRLEGKQVEPIASSAQTVSRESST